MSEHFIEMELREIYLAEDPAHSQVIVLAEKEGSRSFPIFIGLPEALALDMAARHERAPRPLTHDLILNVLAGLRAQLVRVLVVKLEHNTFYGALELRTAAGETVRIDARPSDSIVLATKCGVPIFVAEQVLLEVGRAAEEEEDDEASFEDEEEEPDDEDEEPDEPDEPHEDR